MICYRCGKEFRDGLEQCPYCGASLTGEDAAREAASSSTRKKKKKIWKRLLIIAVCLAVLLIAGGAFLLIRSLQVLKPTDYIEVAFSGMDEQGLASLSFRSDSMVKEILERKPLTGEEEEQIREALSDAGENFSMSKDSNLTNGDIVTVKSSLDEKLLKDYGIVLENDSVQFQVDGLTGPKEIVLNEYISVGFSGFESSGYAYASLNRDALKEALEERVRSLASQTDADRFVEEDLDSYLSSIHATVTPEEGLSNGEEVQMKIQSGHNGIEEFQIHFSWDDETFPVEGLLPTETVSVTDYLSCNVSGYDGDGTGTLSFDIAQLSDDLEECFAGDHRGAYGEFEDGSDLKKEARNAAEIIRGSWESAFTSVLDQETGLKSGDRVTVTCSAPEDPLFLSGIGIYLKGGTKEFTVEDLGELEEIDLAKAMDVTFSGICPDVTVEISIDESLPYLTLTSLPEMEKEQHIQAVNGDTFSGEITYDTKEMLHSGYQVVNSTYSFPISALPSRRLSFESLDHLAIGSISDAAAPSMRELLLTYGSDLITELGGGFPVWNESILEPVALKTAVGKGEDGTDNRLYLTYQAAIPFRNYDRTASQADEFLVLSLQDVLQMEDGSLQLTGQEYGQNLSLYRTREEAQAFIDSDLQSLESAAVLEDLSAEEPVSVSAEGIPELSGEEELPQPAKAGAVADAALGQAARTITWEGHTYARYDLALSWSMAKTFCETAGGHLATETSKREKAIIAQLLNDAPGETYWLGATDSDWTGSWQWVTQEPLSFTDWAKGQPDNSTGTYAEGEHFLEISKQGDGWNDAHGEGIDSEKGFILETEPVDSETAGAKVTYLADLYPYKIAEAQVWDAVTDSSGADHFGSLGFNATKSGMAIYRLSGKYAWLDAVLGASALADPSDSMDLAIWGDGKLLFSRYGFTRDDALTQFRLNVEGVDRLCIQSANSGSSDNGWLFLHDSKLTSITSDMEPEALLNGTLQEAAVIDASGYEDLSRQGMTMDPFGAVHETVYGIHADGSILWNLGGLYTSLEGTLYAGTTLDLASAPDVSVFLDGEEILSAKDVSVYTGYLPLSLDLTGKRTLEVRVIGGGETGDPLIFLADPAVVRAAAKEQEPDVEVPSFSQVPLEIAGRAADIVSFGNTRYYRFDEPISWEQAVSFCESAGGILACPETEREKDALVRLLNGAGGEWYWIGGSFNGTGWIWETGESADVSPNWAQGSPSGESFAGSRMAVDREGYWVNRPQELAAGFIMEATASAGQVPGDALHLGSHVWFDSQGSGPVYVIDEIMENGIPVRNLHPGIIRMEADTGAWFKVVLDGTYSRFTAGVGLDPTADVNASVRLAVFGDGKLLYEKRQIGKAEDLVPFSVDISGVHELTVEAVPEEASAGAPLYLDAMAAGVKAPEGMKVGRLLDLPTEENVGTETVQGLSVDSFGTGHDRVLAMHAGEAAHVRYTLSGQFTAFSGTLTFGEDSRRESVTKVTILADGETIYEADQIRKEDGPVTFEIDVSGKTTLEISAEADGEDTWIYLADDCLR